MNLRTAIASGTRFIGHKLSEAGKGAVNDASTHAENELSGMAARVAERVADNPKVIQAIDRIGTAASKPISKAVEPKIIIATVVAVVVILGVVAASRRS